MEQNEKNPMEMTQTEPENATFRIRPAIPLPSAPPKTTFTMRTRFRFWKGWKPSAKDRVCISGLLLRADCIIWFMKL